jgi:hypothetical protein
MFENFQCYFSQFELTIPKVTSPPQHEIKIISNISGT